MMYDALFAGFVALLAIVMGFALTAGAPIALTVAVERVRERLPASQRSRGRRGPPSRHPYR